MSALTVFLISFAVVAGISLIVFYFLGKRAQKKQEEQNEIIQQSSQQVSMLIIDKKKMRITQSGLPQQVIDQTKFIGKLAKMPIVKAKVGPRVATFVCDPQIFGSLPVKKEVKASISGVYISAFRELHGKRESPQEKKKGLLGRFRKNK